MNISIIGAGQWGVALGQVLANSSHHIKYWVRNKSDEDLMNISHQSKYYPSYLLDENLSASTSLEEVFNFSDIIVISIPVVNIFTTLDFYLKKYPFKKYIMTSKGLYNGMTLSQIFASSYCINQYALLSGPSFASEVMEHKKTAVVVASLDNSLAQFVQELFSNEDFKVYTSDDLIGIEYCGALKNVFAIVAGMVDYQKMGQNTKNALITRGLYEMSKIVISLKGNPTSVFGLAGIGDLMLTCNSFSSRNYSFGYQYLENKEAKGTIEGINTLYEIHRISEVNSLDTPIIHSLYLILEGCSTIEIEAALLMNRAKKDEFVKY